MATYNDIKKIKIGDNVFVIHVPTASEVGALPSSTTIPTKTSQLTNDSGFITTDTNTTYTLSGALSSHKFTSTLTAGGSGSGTSTSALTLAAGSNVTLTDNTSTKTITIAATDTKVTTAALTSGTTYYPILATGTGTATRQIDSTLQSFIYKATAGTTSTNGTSALELGNPIASGTANNQQGGLILYSSTRFATAIKAGTLTAGRTLTLPDKTGTVALIDDVEANSTPIGIIQAYAGSTAPTGWLICDGSAVSRTTYSELFGVIGTTYGSGNGSTTFNLPDLRGRAPIGSGLGTAEDAVERTLGQSGGSERVTLSVEQIPSHNHAINTWKNGAHYYNATSGNTLQWWSSAYGSMDANVSSTGGGQSHGNMQPYLAINYIIKVK